MNRTELIQFALRFLKSNLDDDAVLVINGKDTATDDEFAEYMIDLAESAIDDALLAFANVVSPDDFMNENGNTCPVCGGPTVEATSCMDVDLGSAYQPIACCDCDAEWEDAYLLIGVRESSLE